MSNAISASVVTFWSEQYELFGSDGWHLPLFPRIDRDFTRFPPSSHLRIEAGPPTYSPSSRYAAPRIPLRLPPSATPDWSPLGLRTTPPSFLGGRNGKSPMREPDFRQPKYWRTGTLREYVAAVTTKSPRSQSGYSAGDRNILDATPEEFLGASLLVQSR
ncbi:hypothetical protein PAXINDRAFT_16075 [Paxillus involutus ATCC 200175]|uniref:Uncharacterized protein n=1 Tax=Paxillus involutus ATCC 200175 TaxID=664439 RepID=A0A0C9TJS4_PAXIN|nr:hypothetical protein PAXINDRAFT_16075 [Paxillus involutus ATCC 200175]